VKLEQLNLHPRTITQSMRHVGWPVLVGIAATLVGIALSAAAWYYKHHLTTKNANEPAIAQGLNQGDQSAPASEPVLLIPDDAAHLDDLREMFRQAKAKTVTILAVEYRQELKGSLGIRVRTVDLRMQEDYPKLKRFVAELLMGMPHLSLNEIRVERKDATALDGEILLSLSFVYRVVDKVGRE
jgi:hypothetical protein